MQTEFEKKLEIFRGMELEDVLEFMSLHEAERIRKLMKTEHLNRHLLQKHFKNCHSTKSAAEVLKVSNNKNRITTINLNSKLVTEIFNLRNYGEIKGDWDSDSRYWSHVKQKQAKLGRFHTTLKDYKLEESNYEYVYLYIEIQENEEPETEFEKRINNLYETDNLAITCQIRDGCVIIYLDWHRDYDIW